jgi:L-histidine N-alpha-methyltransferase
MAARSEARARNETADEAPASRDEMVHPAEARSAIPRIGAVSYRVDTADEQDVPYVDTLVGDDWEFAGGNAVIGLHLVAEPFIVDASVPAIAANNFTGSENVPLDPLIIATAPVVDAADEAPDFGAEAPEFAPDESPDSAADDLFITPDIVAKAPTVGTTDSAFRADVLAGLSTRPRAIPARWFYDRNGSELFEAITHLPEYYLTRVERGILTTHAADVAALTGPGCAVVEFGSGSSAKTPLLLCAVAPSAYIPIDISGEFLRESAAALAQQFPDLPVQPLEGDFMRPLELPASIVGVPRLGFFPGSTIGNMTATAAIDLLRAMAGTLGEGSMLLIGIDRIKAADILVPAYDDAQGVTAEFNLNLLRRINRELDANIPIDDFRHVAVWNDTEARIEMHLQATRDVSFTVDGHFFAIAEGETIHTENSHKYGSRDARLLLRASGWTPIDEWTDEDGLFALILAEARPIPAAP